MYDDFFYLNCEVSLFIRQLLSKAYQKKVMPCLDPSAVLSIWLGTSMSSVACVALRQYQCQSPPAVAGVTSGQPPQGQSQQSQSSTRKMLYSPSNLGLVCSVKGALISICFLDSTGQILKQPDETNTDRKTGGITLIVFHHIVEQFLKKKKKIRANCSARKICCSLSSTE